TARRIYSAMTVPLSSHLRAAANMHKRVAYNAIDDRRTTRGACVRTSAYENVHNLAPANFRSGKKSSLVTFNIPGCSSLRELLEDTQLQQNRITILVVSYLS